MSDTNAERADLGNQPPQPESASTEAIPKLHERALARLHDARKKAADVQVVVVTKGKMAAHATDDFVHEQPWASVGIAAGVGLLIGLLINRD